jgi:hypothetical protein
MTTQSSEPSQALTGDETRDRDESPEARHIRESGLARATGSVRQLPKGETCLRMDAIPRASKPMAT